jgi:simple sugar transport system permease protein
MPVEMLAAGLGLATPLLLGALGAILAERGGSYALSLEGQMLAGALAAAAVAGPLGVGAAMAAGLAVAGVAGFVTTRCQGDQLATGIAVNLLVLGLAGMLVPLLPALTSGGPGPNGFTWLGLLLVPVLAIGLGHSAPGLALRATGEDPAAVAAAGLRPARIRALGMLAGGLLGGLAGAALALQQDGGITGSVTGGRGYLALAVVIVGRWRPGATLLACLGFGGAEALLLPAGGVMAQVAPYGLALLALALFGRRAGRPAALGWPIGGRATAPSPLR